MGALPSQSVVSLDEYLTNPEYEHFEWVDGEVIDHHVGTYDHSEVQVACGTVLRDFVRSNPVGRVFSELHCRLRIGGRIRYRLPDVCFISTARLSAGPHHEGAPDLAIEIRSPEDSVHDLLQKAEEYFANGASLCWIILPEEKSVLVIRPDRTVRSLQGDDSLDAADLLPGFAAKASDLFNTP